MPEVEGTDPELGAATPDELAATAAAKMGTYSDPSLPAHRRFLMTAVEVVRRRRAQPNGAIDPQQIAVFLLCDRLSVTARNREAAREPLFSNGATELNGRVWLTSVEMTAGYRLDPPEDGDGVIFDFIEEGLHLGTVPTVVFDPRPETPVLRLYPNGVANEDNCEFYELNDYEFTFENLIATLDHFYDNYLKTPDCAPLEGRVWKEWRRWIPVPKTEGKIQAILVSNLVGAFRRCVIRHEESTGEGRADIFVVQRSDVAVGGWVYLTALELKVLRSFTSSGTRVPDTTVPKAVEEGLKQAVAYRTEREAQSAVLCCYDMRREDTGEACFEPIRDPAKEYDVELKRWYLYNSSKTYRDATYPT